MTVIWSTSFLCLHWSLSCSRRSWSTIRRGCSSSDGACAMADKRERYTPSRRFASFAGMAALAAALFLPQTTHAQNYPSRPVRLILPFGAGGVADVTARLVTEKLGEKLGQRFVIENMAGAGGINAARAVLSAPADGYTLALLSNGTAISVSLFKSLGFNPVTDFVPVSSMGYFDFIL